MNSVICDYRICGSGSESYIKTLSSCNFNEQIGKNNIHLMTWIETNHILETFKTIKNKVELQLKTKYNYN